MNQVNRLKVIQDVVDRRLITHPVFPTVAASFRSSAIASKANMTWLIVGKVIKIGGSDHLCLEEREHASTLLVYVVDATRSLMRINFEKIIVPLT